MSSSKDFLDFVLDQLHGLDGVTYRKMMGEYILYYNGKIVGGIYDDRLLVKPTKSAISFMPNASYDVPYDGAKEMLTVDCLENADALKELFKAMYEELPPRSINK